MQTKYRVRLKRAFKLKLTLVFAALVSIISLAIWLLVSSSLYQKQDSLEWRYHRVETALKCYPVWRHREACNFEIYQGKIIAIHTYGIEPKDNNYCVAKLYNNGKFKKYGVTFFEDCE
jgi:cyanate permease